MELERFEGRAPCREMQRAADEPSLEPSRDLLAGCPQTHEQITVGGCPVPPVGGCSLAPGSRGSVTSELMKPAKSLIGRSRCWPLAASGRDRDRCGWITVVVPSLR